jgi:biotin carboxyl carrier protein
VAVGNTVGLIEVMQSSTPIVAEQAGVRNPPRSRARN